MWTDDKVADNKIEDALQYWKLLTPYIEGRIRSNKHAKKKLRLKKMMAERESKLDAIKEFMTVPEVEEWKKQFLKVLRRYKFLVLHGKSRTRKTEFAKWLFKTYHHHKDKIDWSPYDWEEHECVIYDDVSAPDNVWKYVIKNKMMFQSGGGLCPVNTSATNCYKIDICLADKPQIICTNIGLLDKDFFVEAEHRDWIEANSVWINVDRAEEPGFPAGVVLRFLDEAP
jgi:hypothetical protein